MEDKKTDAFLDEVRKKRVSDEIRQRNREKKLLCETAFEAPSISQNTSFVSSHERKNEQGLIQRMISTKEENVIKISANNVCPNQDIISLYKDACEAEVDAIEKKNCAGISMLEDSKACIKILWPTIILGRKKQRVKYTIASPNIKRKTLCELDTESFKTLSNYLIKY